MFVYFLQGHGSSQTHCLVLTSCWLSSSYTEWIKVNNENPVTFMHCVGFLCIWTWPLVTSFWHASAYELWVIPSGRICKCRWLMESGDKMLKMNANSLFDSPHRAIHMTLHNEISVFFLFFFLFEIEPSCILVCRQGKFQVLEFTQSMKIIKMMVEVTNFPAAGKLAEDAHQATLNITVPGALVYSGVRSSVRPQGAAHPSFSPCQPFIKFSFSNYLSVYLSILVYLFMLWLFSILNLPWPCVQDHDVECFGQNIVICELGNPLRGNEKVACPGLSLIFIFYFFSLF